MSESVMRICKIFSTLLLLALVWVPAQNATAQVEKEAQAGFRFLENPVSAEAIGRGGVGVTMMRNASALFWNPAGIAWLESGVDVGFHYTVGFADIDQMSAAVASNLGSIGVVGLSITRMDYGTFYLTRRANNEQGYDETGEFTPQALAVGLAYGRAMSDRFTFGVQAKLVHQDLGDAWIAPFEDGVASDPTLKSYSMTVPAVDVGASYDFQAYGLTFGAAFQNVSYEVRYEEEQFPLPFNVRFSMTVEPITFMRSETPYHNVTLGAETWKGRDFGSKMQFGAEYSFMDQFFVRAGYMGGYSERGMTLGAGFHRFDFRFDYAYQQMGVLGNIHALSLAYALGR